MQETYLGPDGEVFQIESEEARALWEEDTIDILVGSAIRLKECSRQPDMATMIALYLSMTTIG